MNKLPLQTRKLIIRCLVEGQSIRATARTVEVSKNTVAKLLIDAGAACQAYHDTHVRDLNSRRVQCNEIWSICPAKAKERRGRQGGTDRRRGCVDLDSH